MTQGINMDALEFQNFISVWSCSSHDNIFDIAIMCSQPSSWLNMKINNKCSVHIFLQLLSSKNLFSDLFELCSFFSAPLSFSFMLGLFCLFFHAEVRCTTAKMQLKRFAAHYTKQQKGIKISTLSRDLIMLSCFKSYMNRCIWAHLANSHTI